MAFEQLVAEAAMKKEKESKKKGKEKKDKDSDKASNSNNKFGDKAWSDAASAAASDVPNVPKGSSS
jgi:hypothetical protein